MRITLKTPVQIGETTYQSVTLRRAKAKDMVRIADELPRLAKLSPAEGAATADAAAFDGSVVSSLITIVSALSDLPESAVEEFDFVDLMEIGNQVSDFLSFGTSPGEP